MSFASAGFIGFGAGFGAGFGDFHPAPLMSGGGFTFFPDDDFLGLCMPQNPVIPA
jgi:hypothetical protein